MEAFKASVAPPLDVPVALMSLFYLIHKMDYQELSGFTMRLHVGVGAGPATCMNLGGVNGRFEFTVCGPPLLEVGPALSSAAPGQIVVSPSCMSLLEATSTAWSECFHRSEPLAGGFLLSLKEPFPSAPRRQASALHVTPLSELKPSQPTVEAAGAYGAAGAVLDRERAREEVEERAQEEARLRSLGQASVRRFTQTLTTSELRSAFFHMKAMASRWTDQCLRAYAPVSVLANAAAAASGWGASESRCLTVLFLKLAGGPISTLTNTSFVAPVSCCLLPPAGSIGRKTFLQRSSASAAGGVDNLGADVAASTADGLSGAASGAPSNVAADGGGAVISFHTDAATGNRVLEAAFRELQSVICTIQTVLNRAEAIMKELTFDDKGCVVVAGFGVPPVVHTDDASRAVQTALTLQSQLSKVLTTKAGLTTGVAFCSAIGHFAIRREFAMIGASVNLAARLMAFPANPGVLCDDATRLAAEESRLLFVKFDSIRVKGVASKVSVYTPEPRLRSRRAAPTQSLHRLEHLEGSKAALAMSHRVEQHGASQSAVAEPSSEHSSEPEHALDLASEVFMVGRAAERSFLADAASGLLSGLGGGMIVVEGSAGVGKTVLIESFLCSVRCMGLYTVMATVEMADVDTPFSAFNAVIQSILTDSCSPELAQYDFEEMDDEEVDLLLAEKSMGMLKTIVRGSRASRLCLLNSLCGFSFPITHDVLGMSELGQMEATADIIMALLERALSDKVPNLHVKVGE